MLHIPTVGENKLLAFMLGVETPGNQMLRLYTNDVTPADGNTAASYNEMSTLGYAAKTLNRSIWSIAQVAGKAEGSQPLQTFTFTAGTPVIVYGYFITDLTSETLLWAERFASPKTAQYEGDQIKVVPKITFSTGPAA